MFKSFKTEINPTVEQKVKINKTIGTCRYVYNFYLSYNKTLHDKDEKFRLFIRMCGIENRLKAA